eukprot:scaffold207_cov409-Prasinococcus_capsulatus_cf.AAC.3
MDVRRSYFLRSAAKTARQHNTGVTPKANNGRGARSGRKLDPCAPKARRMGPRTRQPGEWRACGSCLAGLASASS